MKQVLRSLLGRPEIRPLLRQTVGRLPRRAPAGGQPLARDGGTPVRDVRLRPWPKIADANLLTWHSAIRASFRKIYVDGVEGLPQPIAHRFAERWARYCGTAHGLLVGHGTDALRIALAAVLDHDGLEYGGEIIVPNFSFIASATAALDRRVGVALVDVDPATLLLDPARVEEAIVVGRTRAIMAVHLFGQPADMTRLRDIAQKYDLKLIEDAAQAHGAAWSGRRVGSIGDAGAFSFQSFKSLSSGEGGALVTSDDEVFDRAYGMHNVGRSRTGGGRWAHETLGWNCRATEYQAALLLDRLERFERQQQIRARNFHRLRQLLSDTQAVTPLAVRPEVDRHGMYMFVMRYHAAACGGVGIDEFITAVRAEGAPVARGFTATIAAQPVMMRLARTRPNYVRICDSPVADQAVQDTLYVPHEAFLAREHEMDDITAAIEKVERGLSRTGATTVVAGAG